MGFYSVYCGLSNITINDGQRCGLMLLKDNTDRYSTDPYNPYVIAILPIWGTYDDCGGIENIERDENTKLIENYFGCTIEDFCEHFKYMRNKSTATDISKNVEELDKYYPMWVNREFYEFISNRPNNIKMASMTHFLNHLKYSLPVWDKKMHILEAKINAGKIPPPFSGTIQHEYINNIETFAKQFLDALNAEIEIRVLSTVFKPYIWNMPTPQCGEYEKHNEILNKTIEINQQIINQNQIKYGML